MRYTVKVGTFNAIALKWPTRKFMLPALTPEKVGKVRSVTPLGAPGMLNFSQSAAGLEVAFPINKPSDFAWSLEIACERW